MTDNNSNNNSSGGGAPGWLVWIIAAVIMFVGMSAMRGFLGI